MQILFVLTLVTVIKSGPKKTLLTPSISNKTLKQKVIKLLLFLVNSVIITPACAGFYQVCHWWLPCCWQCHFYQGKTKYISKHWIFTQCIHGVSLGNINKSITFCTFQRVHMFPLLSSYSNLIIIQASSLITGYHQVQYILTNSITKLHSANLWWYMDLS